MIYNRLKKRCAKVQAAGDKRKRGTILDMFKAANCVTKAAGSINGRQIKKAQHYINSGILALK